MWRTCFSLAVAALLPAAAVAQVELAAVLGYRGGGGSFSVEADTPDIACLVPPCVVAEASTPKGEVLGLVLDVPIRDGWLLEALLNRQDADLRLTLRPPVGAISLEPESFELTLFQVGLMRRWDRDGLAPFVVAGVGLARAETSGRVLLPPIEPFESGRRLDAEDSLAVSLGAGASLPLAGRWSLRFEGRGYWIDLPGELGGELWQVEVGLGLSVRL